MAEPSKPETSDVTKAPSPSATSSVQVAVADAPEPAPAARKQPQPMYCVLHTVLGRRLRYLTAEEMALQPDVPGIMKPPALPQEPFVRGDEVPFDELSQPTDGYDNIARLESIGAIVSLTDAFSAARRQVEAEQGRFAGVVDKEGAVMLRASELEGERALALSQRRAAIASDRARLERQ